MRLCNYGNMLHVQCANYQQTPSTKQHLVCSALCVRKKSEVQRKMKSKLSKNHSGRLVFSTFQHREAKIPVKMYLFNHKCVGWCRSASSHPVTYSHMLKSELLLQHIMRHPLALLLKRIQFDNLNYCCQHQTSLNNYS